MNKFEMVCLNRQTLENLFASTVNSFWTQSKTILFGLKKFKYNKKRYSENWKHNIVISKPFFLLKNSTYARKYLFAFDFLMKIWILLLKILLFSIVRQIIKIPEFELQPTYTHMRLLAFPFSGLKSFLHKLLSLQ
jgi:hypothetical protein